jgi:hypothetical protein
VLTIYQIYFAIAFVLLLSPLAFYRFTRLENPLPTQDSSSLIKSLKTVLLVLSFPVYFAVCAVVSSFYYLQSYPETSIFGMNRTEWAGYILGDAPAYFGIVSVLGMILFAFGLIVILSSATRRWEAKVWEDPGNRTSKSLRALAYFTHVYLAPLVFVAGLALLYYFFQKEFLSNFAAIPYWLRQATNGRLAEEPKSYLIVFAIAVAINLLVVLWAIICMIRAVRSSFWPKTEATIHQSELYRYVSGTGRNRSVNYRFLVEFTYLFDDFSYTSNRLTYNIRWLNHNKPFIWRQTRRYPLGAAVEVYVNPNKPEDAVLEAGVDWFAMLRLGLYAAFFFVLATIFLIPEVIR